MDGKGDLVDLCEERGSSRPGGGGVGSKDPEDNGRDAPATLWRILTCVGGGC